MHDMDRDALVVAHAMAQGGVIHRRELVLLGISPTVRRRMLDGGLLLRAASSVYVVVGVPLTWDVQLRIALAQAGRCAALSHATAAARWQLPGFRDGSLHVTVFAGEPAPRRTIGTVHRSRGYVHEDVTEHRGLRTTTPIRTILDLSSRLGPAHLDACIQEFARRELVTVDALAERLARWRRSGRNGVRRTEEALDRYLDLPETESWLEAAFLRLLAEHGIPLPETQVWLDADGERYRVDAYWRSARLIVELNGHATHSTRTETGQDAARAARLTAAGHSVVAFTYDQVTREPAFVLDQVRRLLRRTRAA